MKFIAPIFILTLIISCSTKEHNTGNQLAVKIQTNSKKVQDSIVREHLKKSAWKHNMYSKEWQTEIDKGLAKERFNYCLFVATKSHAFIQAG